MGRRKSIDIVRALALLMVLFYHLYVLSNEPYGNSFANRYLILGGEVGVTLFFIISGFGIYNSIASDEIKNGKIEYGKFIRKRMIRILPQYYVCCAFLLLFSEQASLLGKIGIKAIISHIFLIHNIWRDTHGSINGALWTIGVTFQFYLIAPVLYRLTKRKPILTLIFSIAVSVICKYILFHFFLSPREESAYSYFIYGRQALTALDNFCAGMFLAQLLQKNSGKPEKHWQGPLAALIIGLAALLAWLYPIASTGLYEDFCLAYIWHSGLAIILAFAVYSFAELPLRYTAFPARGLLFISKYEYGIYLWHLPMLKTLLERSEWMSNLLDCSFILTFFVFLAIAILTGYISTELIDGRVSAMCNSPQFSG